MRLARWPAARPRSVRAVPVAVVMAGLAVVVAWLGTATALATAEGVTPVPGGPGQTYDTEFIEDGLYVATAVVAVGLVGLAARCWRPAAAAGLVGAEAALFWGGSETVARYVESGWSDGLEVFVYMVPGTAGIVGFILLATLPARGASADHGRRRRLGAAAPPAG